MKRTQTVIFLLIALFLISSSAYCKSPEEVRKELAQKHIEYSKDAFFDSVKSGDTAIVNLFLDAGMNPNSKQDDQYGLTALYFSIYKEDLTLIKALLSKGANINARIKDDVTPLIAAVESGNTTIVKTLIENGADVNLQIKKGVTALMIATLKEKADIVKILLNSKADVNAKTDHGDTALDFAKQKKNSTIIKLLKSAGEKNAKKLQEKQVIAIADLADSAADLYFKQHSVGTEYIVEGYAYGDTNDNNKLSLCENSTCGKGTGGEICVTLKVGAIPKETIRRLVRSTNYCDRVPVTITCTIWESGATIYAEKLMFK